MIAAGTARARGGVLSEWLWFAIGVFVLPNVPDFLDRQLLAALAPVIQMGGKL
jgi:hypothetical protein